MLLLFLLDDDDDDDDDDDTNDKEEEDIIVVVGSREVYRVCVCVYLSLNVFTLNKSDGISPKYIHISNSESANIPRSTHTRDQRR